jgi:hypothetical protein
MVPEEEEEDWVIELVVDPAVIDHPEGRVQV